MVNVFFNMVLFLRCMFCPNKRSTTRAHLWLEICLCLIFTCSSVCEVHYSIPEEMQLGGLIGNVAKDLGIDAAELVRRSARVVSEGMWQFCELSLETGSLLVKERMDREELCAQSPSCILKFQLLLEGPPTVYSLFLDIQDINDNSPAFDSGQIELEILESTVLGRTFPLESAHDPDSTSNSILHYRISDNEYFALVMNTQVDTITYPELVLKKPLDRESQADHFLTLSGVDGGGRSSSALIHIHVLDANDNIPVFGQRMYKVRAQENSARDHVLIKLNATDLDKGIYGEISYSFSHVPGKTRGLVGIDPLTGEVRVTGVLDYEEAASHELYVQAKDGGGQSSLCKLVIDVMDVNDNTPVILLKSSSAAVPEDASPGTTVALFHVHDLDTGTGGHVTFEISDDVPFKLVSEVKNYFMLVIDGVLDREKCPYYNITVTAMDSGSPPLFSSEMVFIKIADINDNPPVFTLDDFSIYMEENLPQGTSVARVRADDEDEGQNARIFYFLSEDATSFLSVDTETGEIFTARSFDYETSTHLHVQVMAHDGGNPPFTSTCSIWIFIVDQNDNAPVVLYPVQTDGHIVDELVPQAAPAGYLVTKVIAVDADAGHNAWLSYHIVEATQTGLFSIDLHCGEIRTLRQFVEDDEIKQTLMISVSDNGHESLSTTATVNIAIEDGLPVISKLSVHDTDESHVLSDITVYLSFALVAVSSLFLLLITAVICMRLCRCRFVSRSDANLPVFPPASGPPGLCDVSGFNTLQKDDDRSWFLTSASWKQDFRFSSAFVDLDMQSKRGRPEQSGGHRSRCAKLSNK